MISLKTYREYYENVMRRVPGIHSVRVVNVDQDMSDCLKSISSDELPVLFVVVPSAQETGTDPDNVEEDNLCLIFLMDVWICSAVVRFGCWKIHSPLSRASRM